MPMPASRRDPVRYDTVKMAGGWDQVTPTLSLAAGFLRDVTNFEVAPVPGGGYSRIAGYERYDGHTKPSSATYTVVQIASFTNTPTVGQTLTGFTSAATGVIAALGGNYLILTKLSGTFTSTEVVKVGGTTIGTAVPTTTVFTAKLDAQYVQAAADIYRADILVVPGSGPVRGVVAFPVAGVDLVFAFRDNVGATAVDIYKSSGSGWTAVPLYNEISFTAGAVAVPADGATLTQGGVTATIKRVCLQVGAWTGAGTGRLIITNPSGGNFAAGAATISGGATCTLSGIQTAITIAVGGRFEFDLGNVSGQASTLRAYGCDGVNRGFEFDGDTYAPITTGTSPDVPSHVVVHQKQIFFAFRSSIIHSGPTTPFIWTTAGGALEIGLGNTVTNFLKQPGASGTPALGISTVDNVHMLYGTGTANWSKVELNMGIGGIPRTAQLLNQTYWMDDAGVISMRAAQEFGNFKASSITANIQPFVTSERSLVTMSTVHREKSQYRVYFSDGQGLYTTLMNGKLFGSTKVQFPNPLYCVWAAEASDFSEKLYAGAASSGYVYELDKGSSFDGAAIEASMTFNWNTAGAPRVVKKYRKASVEMQGSFYASVNFGYSLGYNTAELLQAAASSHESGFSGVPRWDTFVWDAFTWDGSTLAPTEIKLRGSAENIQVQISSGTNYMQPYTINSIVYHLSGRRGLR